MEIRIGNYGKGQLCYDTGDIITQNYYIKILEIKKSEGILILGE